MTNPGYTRRQFLAGSAASASLLLAPGLLPAADEDLADRFGFGGGDSKYVTREWGRFPFDAQPYDYTFAEIEKHWDRLQGGYLIPFPSVEYVRKRYARYPQLWKELKFQDEDYAMHSRNALEVWLLFFRGNFQEARNLGTEYGGFARVPAFFSQLIQAIYLAETLEEKHALLQDCVNGIAGYGKVFQPRPGDDPLYRADYATIRLGFTYGYCRIAEDVSIPTALARDYVGKVTLSSNDILSVYPEHPMGLALSAGINANLIRRGGKLASGIVFGANAEDAKVRFETSFALAPDMALTRMEYANTLLYIDAPGAVEEAIRQLEMASTFTPRHAVEALDIAYAKKRLVEVRDYQATGSGFGAYDRKRRKYQNSRGENMYCVTLEPFLVSKA